jgi:hypothetical protein
MDLLPHDPFKDRRLPQVWFDCEDEGHDALVSS